jgi:hypothetical protein
VTTLPPPTAECARLVQIMGAEGALALIEWRGGDRMYVPKSFDPASELVLTVGAEATRALVEKLGGEYAKVPQAREWRILIYRQRGLSYAEIARKLTCSQSMIWRVLSTYEMTAKQYDLFC